MDAAIATVATLCVVEPAMTGIGGDCFLLYHDAASQRLYGLNGSGPAPRRATVEELRRRGHRTMPEQSILSVTVPGAIDAWRQALERFGTWTLDRVLQPAIHYAERGYAVSPIVGHDWQQATATLARWPDSQAALLVNGQAPPVGSRHSQPRLARSLRLIAEQGPDVFYRGELAEKIVRCSHDHDGLLELEDFAEYRAEWVEPIHTRYRDLQIFELPPNGQGVTALMMLNMLEQAHLPDIPRLSAEHIHVFSEAFELAIAERTRYVCDPRFSEAPLSALLDKDFAASQWARIQPERRLPHPLASGLPEHRDTTYLTIIDERRNAVSLINSLFHPFGSGIVAGDTGIVLHNRGVSFALDEAHANAIAPGKRPMHTIIPAMVYRDGKPILSFGVMGGHYQAMGHSYVLTNWRDYGLDLQEALDAPRFLPEAGLLNLEQPIAPDVRKTLSRWGHTTARAKAPLGGGQCILIDWDNGVLQGASDCRKDGCAMGH